MGWNEVANEWLSYSTVKVVKIYNWKLGTLHYSIQLFIILYVVGYAIIWDRGYQGTSPVVGTISIKPKGTATQIQTDGSERVWDAIDMTYPSIEANAYFVTTNSLLTPLQQHGHWSDPDTNCTTSNECTGEGEWGPILPTCLQNNTCLTSAWGPVENDASPTEATLLHGVDTVSLFLKSNVLFQTYGIADDNVGSELKNGTNQFYIGDILTALNTDYEDVGVRGAAIVGLVSWYCSFDWWSGSCDPTFSWHRVDDPKQKFSRGFNFRTAYYYHAWRPNSLTVTEFRDLKKLYGLRFFFVTEGEGRRLSVVPLFVNLGSGLALVTVATIIVDFVAVYLWPQHDQYKHIKFRSVKVQDDHLMYASEDELGIDGQNYNEEKEKPGWFSSLFKKKQPINDLDSSPFVDSEHTDSMKYHATD